MSKVKTANMEESVERTEETVETVEENTEESKKFDLDKTVNSLEKGVRQATRTKRAVQRLFKMFG